jgi:hypothetical protein
MLGRKFVLLAITTVFVCSMVFVSSHAAGKDQHFGPFASTSTDNGSCGVVWAIDNFDRFFNVHDNGNGNFSVDEQFKNGSFATIGGDSPGACEPDSQHGSIVEAGITGTFVGYLDFTVTGGTYNPSGCATGDCTTLAGFLAATFPGGTFGCGPSGVCKFGFEYAAGDQNLLYHHWADVSDKTGSDLFRGDIANQ